MKLKQICIAAVLTVIVIASGCGPRKAIVKDCYLIEAKRTAATMPQSFPVLLKLTPFTVAPGFQSRGFVYHTGGQKYESDYYNEYFIPPAQMIAEQTEQWLRDSGLFDQVLDTTSLIEATYFLEGNIHQLYYDVQDADDQKATLEITFYLLSRQGRRVSEVEFYNSYHVSRIIETGDQQQVAESMSRCLKQVLELLEQDLKQHFETP